MRFFKVGELAMRHATKAKKQNKVFPDCNGFWATVEKQVGWRQGANTNFEIPRAKPEIGVKIGVKSPSENRGQVSV